MVYVGKHRLTSADLSQVRLSVVDIIVHPRYSSRYNIFFIHILKSSYTVFELVFF